MNNLNLGQNVRVICFLGGTGDGKTEIATVPASKGARDILLKVLELQIQH